MISLYDYTGKPDKDGRGLKVNAYARLKKQPFKKRLLEFNNTEVFLYTKDFLNEYFEIEKIFNN
jgi:hypothetical protein|tara:strand:- start:231 stop:422 length:192 start_codon:yes stop_codon:yes gene_type:complete